MSGLETLGIRLNYCGGEKQIARMNLDKLKSLKKALLYSYQSATAILKDGREFKCLINPDKLKNMYDDKILSIPYEDVCLNGRSEEKEETGIKPGDVFTWKENGTDWIVFLQRYEETAYFRAEIRRCKYTITLADQEYKCYAARPSVDEINWDRQKNKIWNEMDYSLEMYITKDEITSRELHRFAIVKINNRPWEIQSIDDMSSDGIIIVYLKEWYNNSIEDAAAALETEPPTEINDGNIGVIIGPAAVYPYDKVSYIIENAENGEWFIGSQKAKILDQDETSVTVEIVTGRSGSFDLVYKRENEEDITLKVIINSL